LDLGTNEALLPLSGGPDQAVGYNAEPEVHDQAPIHLKGPVARQVEHGPEEEVGHVSHDDGKQGLNQIDEHGYEDLGRDLEDDAPRRGSAGGRAVEITGGVEEQRRLWERAIQALSKIVQYVLCPAAPSRRG
jgi:hypothetical protein